MSDVLKPAQTVVRRRRRQAVILAGAGALVGIIILVVVANLDRGRTAQQRTDGTPPGESSSPLRSGTDTSASAPPTSRGWIQITDDAGQLAQQYRCSHLEPNPDGRGAGWIRMRDPEIEVHLSGGTLIAMRSLHAMVHAPNNSVESGELSGDVIIHIYEGADAPGFSLDRVLPSTRIRTENASFNSLLGTVVCPADIRIETQRGEFDGSHLRLWLSDGDTAISNLVVDQVHHIRIARDAEETAPAAAAAPTNRSLRAEPAAYVRDDDSREQAQRERRARRDAQGRSAPQAKADDEPGRSEPWYRLRLHRDVRVISGEHTDGEQRITGEELTILFTLHSKSALDRRTPPAPPDVAARFPQPPGPLAQRLLALPLASLTDANARSPLTPLAPAPGPGDIMIRCAGNLTIRPAESHQRVPDDPEASVLEMTGQPVRLEAPRDQSTARAARLLYHTADGRIEMHSDGDEEPVRAAHRQFHLECRMLWIASGTGTGRLHGPGSMRFLRPDDERAGDSGDLVVVDWDDEVDLSFASAADGGKGADLTALRKASFRGGADVRSLGGADNIDLFGSGASEVARLTGDEIDIDFVDGGDGQPVLRAISAREHVLVESERRSLRAQAFRATLPPPRLDASADGTIRDIEYVSASGAVHLTLPGGEEVFADALDVDGTARTAVLTGQNVRLVDARHLIDQAQRIEVDDAQGIYRIVGRGRFWRFAQDDDHEIGAPGPATAPGTRREELRIVWRDGVTAAPGVDEDDRPIRLVQFSGDVRVLTPDLRLDGAEHLTARMREGSGQETSEIDRIIAQGAVDVRLASGEGRVRAEELEIDLVTSAANEHEPAAANGELRPRRMLARGDVLANDAESSVACTSLEVFFTDQPAPDGEDRSRLNASVDHAIADGKVRLRLRGGELVFADRLTVTAATESAVITGQPLLVVSQQFMIDQGESLRVDRSTGTYSIDGSGRLIGFTKPMDLALIPGDTDADHTRELALLHPRALEATWSDSVKVRSDEDRAGHMDLRGAVRVISDPAPREQNILRGERVVIEFHGERDTDPEALGSGLLLRRLHATDQAQLENRLWGDDHRADVPRVVSVRGGDIEFHQETLALDVAGPGELLVRSGAADEDPTEAKPAAGFASTGTTLFRWKEGMALRQIVEERFAVRMRGEVECLHRDTDETASTITARSLEAMVERRTDEGASPSSTPDNRGFDPGGSMTLRRLIGEGAVFVRTPRRDLTCDHFDYNLATGVAVLSASPGRAPVSVLTEGVTQPVTAERVVWNLRDDTVTISRGGGGN